MRFLTLPLVFILYHFLSRMRKCIKIPNQNFPNPASGISASSAPSQFLYCAELLNWTQYLPNEKQSKGVRLKSLYLPSSLHFAMQINSNIFIVFKKYFNFSYAHIAPKNHPYMKIHAIVCWCNIIALALLICRFLLQIHIFEKFRQ